MKEFIEKEKFAEILEEKKKFKELYNILKINSQEIIKEERDNNNIDYFCTLISKEQEYIIFYNNDSEDLIQVLLSEKINILDYLNEDLIEEVNVEKPEEEIYKYKGYKFKYLEEPYFIKQIFNGVSFDNTELVKDIDSDINYYRDKVIEKRKDIYDYTKTNEIINQYRFELKDK